MTQAEAYEWYAQQFDRWAAQAIEEGDEVEYVRCVVIAREWRHQKAVWCK